MLEISKEQLQKTVESLQLPKYNEVPDVGLYLDQVVKYINSYLNNITQPITTSMVSNYVKKKIIASPVKKQYSRDQIIYIMMITIFKNVMSLDQITLMFDIQKKSYNSKIAYNYFYLEFYNNLEYVFGIKDQLDYIGSDSTDEKLVFKNAIITICHKIYMDQLFTLLKQQADSQ